MRLTFPHSSRFCGETDFSLKFLIKSDWNGQLEWYICRTRSGSVTTSTHAWRISSTPLSTSITLMRFSHSRSHRYPKKQEKYRKHIHQQFKKFLSFKEFRN